MHFVCSFAQNISHVVGAMDEVVAGLGTAVAPGTQTLLLIPVLVSTNDCEGIDLWGT